jgi:two-component system, cell cycle response regulator
MPSGGHTTVIQRILERRAEQPRATHDETTATVAVMVRVVPSPRALLAFGEPALREQLERRITPDLFDLDDARSVTDGLKAFAVGFCPVVFTDSLELIRQLRAQQTRAPFIVYVSGAAVGAELAHGLAAGADECIGPGVSDRELDARIASARRIAELEAVLRVTLEENRKLSATDDLTRVASRRFFSRNFPREVERAARYGRPLSLILCDIDHFKTVNDTHGHACGDQILKEFGARLQQVLRRGADWVARIGGEEFAVVLPETGYQPALEVARKLRTAVASAPFRSDALSLEITASFGVCGLDRVAARERLLAQRILKIADAALYRSKQSGRNRVTATQLNAPAE